jgi:hypothetical protein
MVDNNMYGYLLGFLFSFAIAAGVVYLIFVMAVGASCGGSNVVLDLILFLAVLGVYLAAAFVLAIFAQRIFGSDQWLAFALNASSIVFVISLIYLLLFFQSRARRREREHHVRTAIADATFIHLEAPFVKKIQNTERGVVMFLHVPFTVSRIVSSKSLLLLAPWKPESDLKFSSNPYCHANGEPLYGFCLVDREYTESPLPADIIGRKVVPEKLEPEKRYFLLRVLFSSFGFR